MRSTLLGLALGIASVGCGGPTPSAKRTTAPPRNVAPGAGSLTLSSDDEFIANGREIVGRLVAIFTADGQDCEKLAADVSKLSEDPIWSASTHYEDAHPEVRERFAAEQAEMAKRFGPAVAPAMAACADNRAFAAALAKMR
ncbi:MAG TPA: hypothetical protein VH143_14740 [Kofleriaceae bacterium]|jgi:hypothetical protein|nr:hypothetical protein [Kofleriaceae bacterium]